MNGEKSAAYRATGRLMAAKDLLSAAYDELQANDAATHKLVEVAKIAVEKAVLSAWEYADQLPEPQEAHK